MEILWEDANLIVCIKPAGVASQADGDKEAMPALLARLVGRAVYPVHRLDKPVSGVMVYAKTSRAAAALSSAIQTGAFEKDYLAVLRGTPAAPSGRLTDLLYHDPRRNKTFVVARQRRGVREAALDYETLAQSDGMTLVRVRLLTGRTHQIRAQFAARGTPLCGDGAYGGGSGALGLWCCRLEFPNPAGGAAMVFARRPPDAAPWNRFSACFPAS